MSYGDHFDEPARCHKCDQPRSTHDDGECSAVGRSMMMSEQSKTRVPFKEEPMGKKKVRCPVRGCNSTQVYVRLKSREIVCRDCGTISQKRRVKVAA